MATIKYNPSDYSSLGAIASIPLRATALKTGDPDGEPQATVAPRYFNHPDIKANAPIISIGDNYAGADVKFSGGAGGKAPAGG
ncbi:unnamed protein product, partial [marine sediment metagenome]